MGEPTMDRRQRKTRQAVFTAFIELLSHKKINQITVADIIEKADIGRATFYAHFETKDYLLKELCEELFCHIFDSLTHENHAHHHIFECDAPSSVFLHLFQHLHNNDNQILQLLSCQNNGVFLDYFKTELHQLVKQQNEIQPKKELPLDYWQNHITTTCLETIRWWIKNGLQQSPETLVSYLYKALQ